MPINTLLGEGFIGQSTSMKIYIMNVKIYSVPIIFFRNPLQTNKLMAVKQIQSLEDKVMSNIIASMVAPYIGAFDNDMQDS